MRCRECGDVRWSFTGLTGHHELRCELCGAEMVPERRQPHRGPEDLGAERRDLTPAGHWAPDEHPATH